MSMTKVRLEICGGDYVISTNDDEIYLKGISGKLDIAMQDFMRSAPTASVTTAAVLVALSFLDDLQKSQTTAENMRGQIKDYLEDAARSKMELEDVKRELNRTKRELSVARKEHGVL